jgi:hypothetical protein
MAADKNNHEFNKLYNLLCSLSTKTPKADVGDTLSKTVQLDDTLSTKTPKADVDDTLSKTVQLGDTLSTKTPKADVDDTLSKITPPIIKSTIEGLIKTIDEKHNILVIDDVVQIKDLVIRDLELSDLVIKDTKRKYKKAVKPVTFRIQYPPISQIAAECYTKAITGLEPRQCRFCELLFQTDIEHSTHYEQTITCNRMAIEEWKKIVQML